MVTRIITPPSVEPVSLTEVRGHLNYPDTANDTDLLGKVVAARRHIEGKLRRKLVEHVIESYLYAWPRADYIELPFPPLVSVVGVWYTNTAEAEAELATTEYGADVVRGRVVLRYNKAWPSVNLSPVSPIRVRFRCGYLKPFTATAATDALASAAHGLSDGDTIRLSNTGGALPSPLAAGTDYFVVSAAVGTLQVSLTSGGAAVDLADAGTGTHFIGEVPAPIKIALMMRAGALVENRESDMASPGAHAITLPIEDDLLAMYADLKVPD